MEGSVLVARKRFEGAIRLLARPEAQAFLFGLILYGEGYRETPPPPPGEDLLKGLEDYGLVLAEEGGGFRPTKALVDFFHLVSKGVLWSFVQAGERAQEVQGAFARAEEGLQRFEEALGQRLFNNALVYLRQHREVLEELAELLGRMPESLRQLVRADVETKLAEEKITLAEAWARLGEVQEKAGLILESLERLRGPGSLEAKGEALRERLPLLLAGLSPEAEDRVRAEMRRAEETFFRLATSVKAKAARDIDEAIRFFQRLNETFARQMRARREVWALLERLAREGLEVETTPLFLEPERTRLPVPAEERWDSLRADWGEALDEAVALQVLEAEALFAEEAEEPETLRELAEAFLASPHATLSAFARERGLGETQEALLALYLYERREGLLGVRFATWSDGWTLWIREVLREEAKGHPGEAQGEGVVPR